MEVAGPADTTNCKFPIGVFDEPVRARNDHCADRIGTLNVAVIVDFDPVERTLEANAVATPSSSWRCDALSGRRRPSASRAAARMRPTSRRLSPRRGTASVTRPPWSEN